MSDARGRSVRAVGTPRARSHSGLGPVLVGLGLSVAAAALVGRMARGQSPRPAPSPRRREALRRSRDGSAILSFSVLADSALEHYRGGFARRPMYASPMVGALSLAADLSEPRPGPGATPVQAAHASAVATGLSGLVFHLRNVTRRPGGLSWNNLFYAAPLGAPGALLTAGLIGAVTHRMGTAERPSAETTRRHGRELAALSSVALTGQSAEVGLLHLRGAYHDPFMYAPVTLPPLAAAGLAAEAMRPGSPTRRRGLCALLNGVRAVGIAGVAFHALGVARMMGGWSNWRQNALQGPPAPAPIAFVGLGETGLAALDLLEAEEDQR